MSDLKLSDNISVAAKEDIEELHGKIQSFTTGEVDEDKFRAFRLARGVYGQRQEGVQMIRIKLPYGKFNSEQLVRIADIADKYATEKMHATTRQDIQIHYVKLTDSPKLWAELEEVGVTLREACGNTVRNVTASPVAGIDKDELFDVTPHAHAFFQYFLRNPICQEMGRKFKVAFSSSEKDSAFTFMHDLGFIPKIKDGKRGFQVCVGGGLGAQPFVAHTAFDFLPEKEFIPFSEAVLRVFDRYGERASRGKARMKFLIKKVGFERFMELVEEQKTAVINKTYPIDQEAVKQADIPEQNFPAEEPKDAKLFEEWKKTNVFEQKQKGYYGVNIKLLLGNILNETARRLATIIDEGYAADDIRVTVNQGFLLRHVSENALVPLFNRLYDLDLTSPGFDSTADITACPGTDTCNLGIASSTGLARELERLIHDEYRDLIYNNDIKIKISGCMNACGQHNIANIGFQGMTIRKNKVVLPAMQILLGGGFDKEGKASIANKVVKVPSKHAPQALRVLLQDFDENAYDGEYFNNYYQRQIAEEKMYFFNMLKPIAQVEEVTDDLMVDWGNEKEYEKKIGVGECAGVILDLVGTLIEEAEEKFYWADKAINRGTWPDSIYHSYNTFIVGAKALLIGEGITCNTHINIIEDFDTNFVEKGYIDLDGRSFKEVALKLNDVEPSPEFAQEFYNEAKNYLTKVREARKKQISRMEAEEVNN